MDAATPFDANRIAKAWAGDEGAQSRLLRRLAPLLRRYFRTRLGDGPPLDEVVHDTLARVQQVLREEGIRPTEQRQDGPAAFRALVAKAALYELQDHYRSRVEENTLLSQRTAETAAGAEAAPPADDNLQALIGDEAHRILKLRAYGYDYADIADVLDRTEADVKQSVKRAFDAVRDAQAGA
jgi:RNA polymerase sigma-70 factor (ECF subfamily)